MNYNLDPHTNPELREMCNLHLRAVEDQERHRRMRFFFKLALFAWGLVLLSYLMAG